jgi:hypothetical protein
MAGRKELYAKLHSVKQNSIYLHSRENKSDVNVVSETEVLFSVA